jgi:tetratricopeptide (TPR) repeat protein
MSAHDLQIRHSSLKTPFWESLAITPNLKYAISQTFPDDDVPEPTLATATGNQSDALNHSKLLAVKDILTKTVAQRNETLEPTNKLRFTALHTVGMICAELGQWEEAETVYNKLIKESDRVFGPDAKQAAGAVSNLGNVYEQQGKYMEAEATLRRTLTWTGKNLGEESPQYLGGVRGMISVLEKQRKIGEAGEMLKEGLAIVGRMSGPYQVEETEEMQKVAENFKGLKE